ncbi:MAG TPA: hypothetical protein VGD67_12480 [Pseudonocardiaceae bacterium]
MPVLFQQRFWAGIADGSVSVTFRRWRRVQARPGTRRTAAGIIEVTAVDEVTPADITRADALAAGYPDVPSLLADLRGTPDLPLYRIRFRPLNGPDPRSELAARSELTDEEYATLDARLRRLDREVPWTLDTLRLIAERPEVRAGDLAAHLGRERDEFKLDVRKLKNLGLTLSFPLGYRLSPRGEAYLARRARDGSHDGP